MWCECERAGGGMDAITVVNAIISVINFMLECRQVIEPAPLFPLTHLPFLAPSDHPPGLVFHLDSFPTLFRMAFSLTIW